MTLAANTVGTVQILYGPGFMKKSRVNPIPRQFCLSLRSLLGVEEQQGVEPGVDGAPRLDDFQMKV